MNEVIICIYNDAYNMARNCGATEDEAREYAESYKENVSSYLEDYYI